MFTYTCSHCERRQLIFGSQVTSVKVVDGGLAYSFTCWCGQSAAALDVTKITERSQTVRAA